MSVRRRPLELLQKRQLIARNRLLKDRLVIRRRRRTRRRNRSGLYLTGLCMTARRLIRLRLLHLRSRRGQLLILRRRTSRRRILPQGIRHQDAQPHRQCCYKGKPRHTQTCKSTEFWHTTTNPRSTTLSLGTHIYFQKNPLAICHQLKPTAANPPTNNCRSFCMIGKAKNSSNYLRAYFRGRDERLSRPINVD